MYDIDFIKNSYNIRKEIVSRKFNSENVSDIEAELEQLRKSKPTIFNIETTNYCNMKCVMCPRTIYMTRKNIWISDEIFEKALSNIKTYNEDKLNDFWKWLETNTPYNPSEVSENGFYFSIVSKCLILHGYGEPFLDKYLIKRLKLCNEKKIPTYFSCTPAAPPESTTLHAVVQCAARPLRWRLARGFAVGTSSYSASAPWQPRLTFLSDLCTIHT